MPLWVLSLNDSSLEAVLRAAAALGAAGGGGGVGRRLPPSGLAPAGSPQPRERQEKGRRVVGAWPQCLTPTRLPAGRWGQPVLRGLRSPRRPRPWLTLRTGRPSGLPKGGPAPGSRPGFVSTTRNARRSAWCARQGGLVVPSSWVLLCESALLDLGCCARDPRALWFSEQPHLRPLAWSPSLGSGCGPGPAAPHPGRARGARDSGSPVPRPSNAFPSEPAHSCLFPVAPAALSLSAAALNGLREPRSGRSSSGFSLHLPPGPGAARTIVPAPQPG